MSEPVVTVTPSTENARYELSVNGTLAGFATYSDSGDVRAIPHTEVDPAYQGRGLSKPLIKAALDDIRAAGKQVLPQCPAVSGYIAKNPEYTDLVPEQQRARFGLA